MTTSYQKRAIAVYSAFLYIAVHSEEEEGFRVIARLLRNLSRVPVPLLPRVSLRPQRLAASPPELLRHTLRAFCESLTRSEPVRRSREYSYGRGQYASNRNRGKRKHCDAGYRDRRADVSASSRARPALLAYKYVYLLSSKIWAGPEEPVCRQDCGPRMPRHCRNIKIASCSFSGRLQRIARGSKALA
jgi:hypothetical protein